MGVVEKDIYDVVFEYLLSEGYSEQESNQIMVSLVNENIWKAVQQRTGIGKPGVGPGQVAKNILRAGITDILGTSIAAGSAPSSAGATKAPTVRTSSPTPVVRTAKAPTRTAPTGRVADPWKGGSTGTGIKNVTRTSQPTPRGTASLPGSNVRGLLKPAARNVSPDPWKGGSTGTGIRNVTRTTQPTPRGTASLPGSNVRGLLKPAARNVSPDPWKQSSGNKPSGSLWNRVQQTIKPQQQSSRSLPSSKTNVRGLLPAARVTSTPATTQKAPEARSQQFRDVQRLSKAMKGGLMGEIPKASGEKPAPKPAWGSGGKQAPKAQTQAPAEKVAPKPKDIEKPRIKARRPGRLDNPIGGGGQGFSLPLGGAHLGAAVAGLQAYNTAKATPASAPKFPTKAKEVKKGETYYDPSTRVGSSQRFAQRKKVGPKIVGPKLSAAQDFDKAYGSAKEKGGVGSTFNWRGKSYKVS